MREIWKPVVGYEGWYEVSDQGRVRSIDRDVILTRTLRNYLPGTYARRFEGVMLSPALGSDGYLTVRLRGKTFTVHSVVLTAFIGPKPAGYAACHNDGNRQNNALSNLRWDTYKANNRERFVHMKARRAS